MKIAFYFATRSQEPTNTLAFKSLKIVKKNTSCFFSEDLDFHIFYNGNNTHGLSLNYNKIIQAEATKYDYIVFLHDDVYVDDINICNKLLEAHKQYDIVGLAGGVNPHIQQPALWHLMCGGFNGGNLRGAVAHPANKDSIYVTSFGPTPSRVAVLDGLFLSINSSVILKADWRFNENYTFHHYDIASCLDANKKKLKLGVAPIWVIHQSPGLLDPNSNAFLDSQKKFLSEYSN
jgi:GT2 family glycosyltransferase